MTARPGTTPRVRGLPAVLLGVLAVLASFAATPGPALAQAGVTAPPSAAPTAPQGSALRPPPPTPRAGARRDARQAAGPTSRMTARPARAEEPAPLTADRPAAAAAVVLLDLGLVAPAAGSRAARRTAMAHRGRAPPATAHA